jgi:hypothetical protein
VATVVHIFENETLVAFTPKMTVAAMPAAINTYWIEFTAVVSVKKVRNSFMDDLKEAAD